MDPTDLAALPYCMVSMSDRVCYRVSSSPVDVFHLISRNISRCRKSLFTSPVLGKSYRVRLPRHNIPLFSSKDDERGFCKWSRWERPPPLPTWLSGTQVKDPLKCSPVTSFLYVWLRCSLVCFILFDHISERSEKWPTLRMPPPVPLQPQTKGGNDSFLFPILPPCSFCVFFKDWVVICLHYDYMI